MKNIILAFTLLINLSLTAELGVSEDFITRFSSLPSYTGVDISPDGKILRLKKSGIGVIYADIKPNLSMQLRKIIPSYKLSVI